LVLLDTNILSEVLRRQPSLAVMKALHALRPEQRFASEVTRYELRAGAALSDDAGRLWQRTQQQVLTLVQWLPFDDRAAIAAADVGAALRRRGEPVEETDLFIAATALVHGFSVATRNARHFERVPGLIVENWFSTA
jgi:predicted nucleic acid-binding protein